MTTSTVIGVSLVGPRDVSNEELSARSGHGKINKGLSTATESLGKLPRPFKSIRAQCELLKGTLRNQDEAEMASKHQRIRGIVKSVSSMAVQEQVTDNG